MGETSVDRRLEMLLHAPARVAGVKQTLRALTATDRNGGVQTLFTARDADPFVTRRVIGMAGEKGVPVVEADSMRALGAACGLQVGAAVAAVLKTQP